jgi:hypothetical protein
MRVTKSEWASELMELALYFCLRRFRHSFWVLIDGIGTLILDLT